MKTSINIKEIPLLHESKCSNLFNADNMSSGYYFMKPIYKWLPDIQELDDDEREKYKFKNVKEGSYLVGLEIISDKWVNKGFCATLLTCYGLVLDDANPVVKVDDTYGKSSMIMLRFDHIVFSLHENFSVIT